ncbi:hypothetical protein QYF61_011009 [Mycteria americana]|uniref:Uncharacterized protein n=1 Tax=Mycteria americana TaxID=33587 RepID=A0AAN7RQH0_MYCAM|nr:hypothetical protein QYF61_011009 [Mycteria americana]
MDYIGPLTQMCRGKRYVLTMVEATTGWLETYPGAVESEAAARTRADEYSGLVFCLCIKRPSLSLNYPVHARFISKMRRACAETTAQAPPLRVPFATQVCQSHTNCFIRDRRVGNLSKSGTKVMRTLVRLTHLPEAPGLPGRHVMGACSKENVLCQCSYRSYEKENGIKILSESHENLSPCLQTSGMGIIWELSPEPEHREETVRTGAIRERTYPPPPLAPVFAVLAPSTQPCLAQTLPHAGAELPDSLTNGLPQHIPSAVDYCTRCASLMLSGASTLVLLLLSNNTG